jgi:hypothetical protein
MCPNYRLVQIMYKYAMIDIKFDKTVLLLLSHDIANKKQQDVCNILNKCNKLIDAKNKWKYVNMKHTAPQIHGTVKLHKPDKPIRSIIHWKHSPGHNLEKHISFLLNKMLPLQKVTLQALRVRAHQGNWHLQFPRKIADFKQATGFLISRCTLGKLTFD